MRHDKPRTFDGDTFDSIIDLLAWLKLGYWVRIGGLPFHPAWITQQKLGEVVSRCEAGLIQRAEDVNGCPYESVDHSHMRLVTPTEEQFAAAMEKPL